MLLQFIEAVVDERVAVRVLLGKVSLDVLGQRGKARVADGLIVRVHAVLHFFGGIGRNLLKERVVMRLLRVFKFRLADLGNDFVNEFDGSFVFLVGCLLYTSRLRRVIEKSGRGAAARLHRNGVIRRDDLLRRGDVAEQ